MATVEASSNIRKVDQTILSNPPANVACPTFDVGRVSEGIVHLSVGGFHRAHEAAYIQELIEEHGAFQWGICGVGIMPQDETFSRLFTGQDCLYTLVERSGSVDRARIIASIKSYLFGPENPEAVFAKMASPETKLVTITATEGGYCINQATGEFDDQHPGVVNDLEQPDQPKTILGYLAESLERRRKAGIAPYTVLSCDNLQGNGEITKKVLLEFTSRRDPELAEWIRENVAFPNSMVDRITPATTEVEREFVRSAYGVLDACPVVSESFRQWVIEDNFSNERPPFELAGVQMTSDVPRYEKMKIRLLNASHSAMGYLGYLSGFRMIHEVALNAVFAKYIRAMMDLEVTPLIGSVPGVNLDEYKQTLMERFSNPTVKDQVLRICLDGSSKMPKFIIPSIADQLERGGPIELLTLCVSSWIRFLSGVDEQGREIPINDPMADRLHAAAKAGGRDPLRLLEMHDLFGDLSQSARFRETVERQLASLYDLGSRATLEAVLKEVTG